MIGLITASQASDTVLVTRSVTGPALTAVHTAAAVCVAMYAANACGRSSRSIRRSLIPVAVLVLLAVLGAAWVVHAGAGIAIFGFSSVVFGRMSKVRRRMLVSSIAVLVFAMMGAEWVLYPFAALIAVRAMNLLGSGSTSGSARTEREPNSKSHCRDEATPVDLSKASAAPTRSAPVPTAAQPDIAAYVHNDAIPAAAATLVREITERSTAAAQYLAQQGRSASSDAVEVEAIRDDYAPEAVRGYLALPPWSASDAILADGRTGAQHLVEQLQLLAGRLQRIQESAAVAGGEQLRTHGAFLRDRFPSEPGGALTL